MTWDKTSWDEDAINICMMISKYCPEDEKRWAIQVTSHSTFMVSTLQRCPNTIGFYKNQHRNAMINRLHAPAQQLYQIWRGSVRWYWLYTPPSKSLASLGPQAACQNIDTHFGIPTVHDNHKLGLFRHHKLIDVHELCIWCESQGQ